MVTKPRAPASTTGTTYSPSSYCVSASTLVLGHSLQILRVASRPVITGIARSMSTTSGASSLAFSTASFPFAASATTSMSEASASRARIPSLTRV